jgi:hypothetical protein
MGFEMRDTRDLRDPTKIGEEIAYRRKRSPKKPCHILAEQVDDYAKIPNYPEDESMGQMQARLYQSEIKERAEAGDRYALSIMNKSDEDALYSEVV